MSSNKNRLMPFLLAICLVAGILIGTFYTNHFSGNKLGIINTSSNKLNALLHIIDEQYVDTVSMFNLVEEAMPQILAELDPHSSYIPAKDLEAVNSDLKGSFSGIGVQFTIQDDTIHINSVIQGGPSEKVGLLAGDRIVEVDDSSFVGKIVTNSEAMRRLKGEKGSKVKLGIYRPGEKEILHFTVVRGDIPVKSIDAAYMINDKFGYVKVNKFGETTYPELLVALAQLSQANCKGMIIDLRGNTGGYMAAAIQMVNEFLPNNKLIVYTEGRKSPRENYTSNGTGSSQTMPLIVLMDEGSASASEIFAGAIQDNDRGTIIGRRSFGKGLVQRQYPLTDGSMIRLTIAHYYTPSGRCIQKPYSKEEDYREELYHRYESGELLNADSIVVNDSLKYYTKLKKRPVYGGGGIIPDVYVPIDTSINYLYFNRLNAKNVIGEYVVGYIDQNREKLNKEYPTFEKFLKNFQVTDAMVNEIVAKGEKAGIPKDEKLLPPVVPSIKLTVKALMARDMWEMSEMYRVFNEDNKILQAALEALQDGTYEKKLK